MTWLDLRAIALGATAWAGAVVGWGGGTLGVGLLAVLAAGVVLTARHRASWVVPCATVLLAAAAVAALGQAARELPPDTADRAVAVRAVVVASPQQLAVDLTRPSAVLVPVHVTDLRLGARAWQVSLPARLFLEATVAAVPPVGAVVTFHGRLRGADRFQTEARAQAMGRLDVESLPDGPTEVADTIRGGLRAAVPDTDGGALVPGIALGDESLQHPDLGAAMRDAGLSHLTAVSGGNFVVLMVAGIVLLRLGGVGLRGQVVGGAIILLGYAWLVGPQPSVTRAGTMAAVGLAGVLAGGPSRGIPLLGACVTVLLLLAPSLALSLGFALSVAATAGLQVLAPFLVRRLDPVVPRWLALPLAVTVAAHIATAPLLLFIGSEVSWVAVPANLLVGPLIGAVTVLGMLAALLLTPAPVLGESAAELAAWLAQGVALTAHVAQLVARSAMALMVGRGLLLIGVMGLVWWVAVCLLGGARARMLAVVTAVGCVWILRATTVPEAWRVIVCDVGQGTAVLARSGDAVVLIDTGPMRGDVTGCLAAAGVSRLTTVVLSHPHADHVAALPQVLTTVPVGDVLVPAASTHTPTARQIETLSAAAEVPAVPVVAGQQVPFGTGHAEVLWPPAGEEVASDDVNNGSVVLLLRWPDGFDVLVPGDIEPESQARIMAAYVNSGVDAVVIPHHGSDHQDPGFARWVAPHVAVASAGADNSYGHPAPTTLAEYEAVGAVVHRTDQAGTVVLTGPP